MNMLAGDLRKQSRETFNQFCEQRGTLRLEMGMCDDGTLFLYEPASGKVIEVRTIEFYDDRSGIRSLTVTLPVVNEPVFVKGRK